MTETSLTCCVRHRPVPPPVTTQSPAIVRGFVLSGCTIHSVLLCPVLPGLFFEAIRMSDNHQTLADAPLWTVILGFVLAALSGEMWRGDKAGLSGWALLKRIALRAGASAVFGMATFLLLLALGSAMLAAVAIGCVIATMGADMASSLYEQWLKRRAGINDAAGVVRPGDRSE